MVQHARLLIAAALLAILHSCSAFQHTSSSPQLLHKHRSPRTAALFALKFPSAHPQRVRQHSAQRQRTIARKYHKNARADAATREDGLRTWMGTHNEAKGAKIAVYGEDVDHTEMVARRIASSLNLPYAKPTRPLLKVPAQGCVMGEITHALMGKAGVLQQFNCVLLLRSKDDSSRMQEQLEKLQRSGAVHRVMVFDAEDIDDRMDNVLQQIRRVAKTGVLNKPKQSPTMPREEQFAQSAASNSMAKLLDPFLGAEWFSQPTEQLRHAAFAGVQFAAPIAAALADANIRVPTKIQELSLPAVCRGSNVIIHAETGSGKTLAYLLPLIKRLFELRQTHQAVTFPFAMIMVPSRELAVQVAAEVVRLTGGNKRVLQLCTGVDEAQAVKSPTDAPILVGTPKGLFAAINRPHSEWSAKKSIALSQRGRQALASIRYLVLDEVDRLLAVPGKYTETTDSKPRLASFLLEHTANASSSTQVVCASATIGRLLRQQIARHTSSLRDLAWMNIAAPTIQHANTTRAVTVPPTIHHFVLKLHSTDASGWLRGVQRSLDFAQPSKCLLFAPDQDSVHAVVQQLHRYNLTRASLLHEAIGFHTNRGQNVALQPGTPPKMSAVEKLEALRQNFTSSKASPTQVPIIVTTHSSARGLHFDQVELVIILGTPKSMDEYLHIAGRTGRAGQPGIAISIVDMHGAKTIRSWQTPLAIKFKEFPADLSKVASK